MPKRDILVGKLILAGAMTAGAGGCANLESFSIGELPVAPGSPVAVAAVEAARNPGPYPTFAGIPKLGADEIPPVASAPASASPELRGQIDQMRTALAAMPPVDPSAPAKFVADVKGSLVGATPPSDADRAEIEAFAHQARARATPPPPPS